jgi:mannan endo-1,4-beta-mannosidase
VDVLSDQLIQLRFDEVITPAHQHDITVNNEAVEVRVSNLSLTTLELDLVLEAGRTYTVQVPAGAVVNSFGVALENAFSFSFTTKAEQVVALDEQPVVKNPSPEVIKVYNYLKEQYGKKSLSGTMSNVSWNINEAEWVHLHTGKWPAMATVDYIHLNYSPANWIDYNDTGFLEDWWAANGLVSAGWHWVVPKTESVVSDPFAYTYKPEETTFKVANALTEGSWEHEVLQADLAEMADYLLLLKEKNIPVLWRPLHEAAGNIYEYNNGTAWFWWGAGGADNYKALWIHMFEYFESRGLNNLLWVWTTQTKDAAFYPGDAYVDIVGRDIYNNGSGSDIAAQFASIQAEYPNKMVTLSEFGSSASFSKQWEAGASWSYFMPWYDYDRTLNPGSEAFAGSSHEHADVAWWQDAAAHADVLWREDLPSLK